MAADFVRRLKQISEEERQAILTRTAGALSPEEADELEQAGSVLLETNVVVAHVRNDWVVLGELHCEALRSPRCEEQRTLIREFLQTVIVLMPDGRTCDWYGQVKADLASVGKPIPDIDLWIAAMAR